MKMETSKLGRHKKTGELFTRKLELILYLFMLYILFLVVKSGQLHSYKKKIEELLGLR